MLIKSADDKSKRLELLRSLQSSPVLDAKQKAWLRDEWGRTTRGIQGERDAAFHINSHACGDKIRFAEGKFRRNQEARFGGFQYCRAHQADVAKP